MSFLRENRPVSAKVKIKTVKDEKSAVLPHSGSLFLRCGKIFLLVSSLLDLPDTGIEQNCQNLLKPC